jgi:hypothetical protein
MFWEKVIREKVTSKLSFDRSTGIIQMNNTKMNCKAQHFNQTKNFKGGTSNSSHSRGRDQKDCWLKVGRGEQFSRDPILKKGRFGGESG